MTTWILIWIISWGGGTTSGHIAFMNEEACLKVYNAMAEKMQAAKMDLFCIPVDGYRE